MSDPRHNRSGSKTKAYVVSGPSAIFTMDLDKGLNPSSVPLASEIALATVQQIQLQTPSLKVSDRSRALVVPVTSDNVSNDPKTVQELKLRGGFFRADLLDDDGETEITKKCLTEAFQTKARLKQFQLMERFYTDQSGGSVDVNALCLAVAELQNSHNKSQSEITDLKESNMKLQSDITDLKETNMDLDQLVKNCIQKKDLVPLREQLGGATMILSSLLSGENFESCDNRE